MTEPDNDRLDAYFAAARRQAPRPSADLLSRLESDAAKAHSGPPAVRHAVQPRAPRWLALGALSGAAAAGLAIGIALPGLVPFGQGADLSISDFLAAADMTLAFAEDAP